MKKLIFGAAALGLLLIVAPSCKTNEANYRAAYEATRQRSTESGGLDSTIYSRMRNEARPATVVVEGQEMPMVTRRVTLAEGTPQEVTLMRYNVVVAQFKQLFNARSMATRLQQAGYSEAHVVVDKEPLYYVVIASCPTRPDALALWQKVSAEKPVPTKAPYPLVLQAAQLAR